MGKDKKKKIRDRINNMDPMYDHQTNLQIANALEKYCNLINRQIIVQGRTKELVDDSKEVIKKAIKNLREGKPEKVFDEERYRLMLEYQNNPDRSLYGNDFDEDDDY